MYDEGEHFSIFCTDVGVRTNSKSTPEEFRNRLILFKAPIPDKSRAENRGFSPQPYKE